MTGLFRLFTSGVWRCQRAATAIEYGLIASAIAVGCIGAFEAFADAGMERWDEVESSSTQAMN